MNPDFLFEKENQSSLQTKVSVSNNFYVIILKWTNNFKVLLQLDDEHIWNNHESKFAPISIYKLRVLAIFF